MKKTAHHSPLAPMFGCLLLYSLTCVGCGGAGGAPHAMGPASPDAGSTRQDGSIPDADGTPAGRALEQVLAWINGAPLDRAGYVAAFDAVFRGQVPFEAFDSILEQVRSAAPWQLQAVELSAELSLVARVTSATAALRVELAVGAEPPHAISGLLLAPADETPFEPPADVSEALERLRGQGELSLLSAELRDGACHALREVDSDLQRPLGSVFKLWVLHAVASDVAAGRLTWDSPVTIEDALDSLPSGTTQYEPPGTALSVQVLATRMIAMSDNTATDHLMALVGRAAVEQAMVATGHSEPSRSQPFLTTRELFILKFGPQDLREAYLAGDTAVRRELLETRVAQQALPELSDVTEALQAPRAIDTLEWFASAHDVCRVLLDLVDDDATRAILARNPGLPAPPAGPAYDYLGFKGGSEAGVLAVAWAHELGGVMRFTVGLVSNDMALLEELETIQLLGAVRDLGGAAAEP